MAALIFFGLIAVFVIIAAVSYAKRPEPEQCPFCKKAGIFFYQHRRVDGGPDRRYAINPIICLRCGNKHGDRPETPEELAELEKWHKHGYDAGRRGDESPIPPEIRPLAGESSKIAARWYQARLQGHREYCWETGFAAGLEGKPRHSGGYDPWRDQAWVEGDAKRQGQHYFPAVDAKVKVKDAEKPDVTQKITAA